MSPHCEALATQSLSCSELALERVLGFSLPVCQPQHCGERRNQGGGGQDDGVRSLGLKKRRVNAVFVYAGLKVLVAESKCAESNGNKSQMCPSVCTRGSCGSLQFILIAQVANLVANTWGNSLADFDLLKAAGRLSSYSGL